MKPLGFVYLLKNPAMPGLFKIGCTERSPHARAAVLSRATGVPQPFEVICYLEVVHPQRVEQHIHQELAALRDAKNREFFRADVVDLVRHFSNWSPRLAFVDVAAVLAIDAWDRSRQQEDVLG